MKIIFLHGFLGSPSDWNDVISFLYRARADLMSFDSARQNKIEAKQPDEEDHSQKEKADEEDRFGKVAASQNSSNLPARGIEPAYDCYPLPLPASLEHFPKLLEDNQIEKCHLVGYSMGGRVALQLQKQYPHLIDSLVILSAHLGLNNEEEKKKRWKIELAWKEKLLTLPLEQFLNLWYAQPLFAGFTVPKERFAIDITTHAHLLLHYSLSKQEVLKPPPKALFLYGEKDVKYAELYQDLPSKQMIAHSGHAIHLDNPEAVALAINTFLRTGSKENMTGILR